MILGTLRDSARIDALHPAFKQLFDYVKSHDLLHEELGRIDLDGDKLFINNSESTLVAKEGAKVEVHHDYIDVHIPLDGVEVIGWNPTDELTDRLTDYDPVKDREFFATPACASYVNVRPGEFLIVYPEDGHAPIIGEGKLRKLCAKVKVNY